MKISPRASLATSGLSQMTRGTASDTPRIIGELIVLTSETNRSDGQGGLGTRALTTLLALNVYAVDQDTAEGSTCGNLSNTIPSRGSSRGGSPISTSLNTVTNAEYNSCNGHVLIEWGS